MTSPNDNTYNEWQESWKNPTDSLRPPGMEALMDKLGNLERFERRRNLGKIIALLTVFSGMATQLIIHPPRGWTWTLPVGTVLIALHAAWFMRSVLKKQFRIRDLDPGLPALDYIRQAILALPAELAYVRRNLPRFLLIMAFLGNTMMAGLWDEPRWGLIAAVHTSVTAFMFLGATLGFRMRLHLFKKYNEPLLKELKETERSWTRGEQG